jgi:hypothetical protein
MFNICLFNKFNLVAHFNQQKHSFRGSNNWKNSVITLQTLHAQKHRFPKFSMGITKGPYCTILIIFFVKLRGAQKILNFSEKYTVVVTTITVLIDSLKTSQVLALDVI